LPHLVMLGLIGVVGWLVLRVFAPLAETALVAAALAAMTHRALFQPIDRACAHLHRLQPRWQRRVAAAVATTVLVVLAASPVVLLLFDALGGIDTILVVGRGLILRDPHGIELIATALAGHCRAVQTVMPAFPLTPMTVHDTVVNTLAHSQASDFYAYLFHGTGGALAKLVLGVLLVLVFYESGDRLLARLILFAPFTPEQRAELEQRFAHTVLRLLNDTLARAVLRGFAMGLAAWSCGGFPLTVVSVAAAFVSLVPVVGPASIWLPLASLLWQRDQHLHAIALALVSLIAIWLVDRLLARLVRNLDTGATGPGLLLFLAIVGGVLSFGISGVVIGPMAVVALNVLLGFWLPLYGVGVAEPKDPPSAASP
jgi:predicted PurR-regulated permease PerM